MILDDLFEISKIDIPTYLRRQQGVGDVTMRDVEAEKPMAYHYMVIEPDGHESFFLSKTAAEQHARGVNGTVKLVPRRTAGAKPVSEQWDPDPKKRGIVNYGMLEKTMNTTQPVYLEFPEARYTISAPTDKKWFVTMAQKYARAGLTDKWYMMMGDHAQFERVLEKFVDTMGDDVVKEDQKKRSDDLDEADRKSSKVSARTQRVLDKLRLKQPQARNDLEALAYTFQDEQKRDRADIQRLEKEADEIENKVKSDLEQTVSKLQRQRTRSSDALSKIRASDQQQADAINKIIALDKQQQSAINDLKKNLGQKSTDTEKELQTLAPAVAAAASDVTTAAEPSRPAARPNIAINRATPISRPAEPDADRAANEPDIALPDLQPATNDPTIAQPDLFPGDEVAITKPAPTVKLEPRTGTLGEDGTSIPADKNLWNRAVSQAREKFDVYPSAYANAWAAKWYKAHGGGWGMGKK